MNNITGGLTASDSDNYVSELGHYKPYDFWLSVCGIYQLYQYTLDLLGDIKGKKILDCGCGRGHISVMLAKRGAIVKSFDMSDKDLETARLLAKENNVEIEFSKLPFEKLSYEDESFDLAIGTFIIHHINVPLATTELQRVLKPGARAVFIENSNRNPLLMLSRKFLVGSFGIPKYGDDDEEHPLTRADISAMKKYFPGSLKVFFPSLVFYRLIDFYIFEKKYKIITGLLVGLDKIFGLFPPFRRMSYFQILQCDKEKLGK